MQLEPLEVKKDSRGALVEAFKLYTPGQVNYLIVNPHESRGGHYHIHKTEAFLVIYGSAEIAVKNRETGDVMKVETSGYKPMLTVISPNHTHLLTATDEGCICLVWCNEFFNPEDQDTYPEEL